ncbi:hypothetical protein [Nonomuraea dietziae]|uniref:hypothetical protein n=1 Tax=Nonomuraea dietziae TaxID=65515 RepID=UPI0033894D2B
MQIVVATTINGLIAINRGQPGWPFLAARPLWLRMQRYFMGTVLGGMAIHLATDRSSRRRGVSGYQRWCTCARDPAARRSPVRPAASPRGSGASAAAAALALACSESGPLG